MQVELDGIVARKKLPPPLYKAALLRVQLRSLREEDFCGFFPIDVDIMENSHTKKMKGGCWEVFFILLV